MQYLALLRGINVGGKNTISMADLKICLESLKLQNVRTYINSGNVLFESSLSAPKLAKQIEDILPQKYKLDSTLIKVLVISAEELTNIVKKAPKDFDKDPTLYHSDVVFLIGISEEEAFPLFETNPEVDAVWKGKGVIYFQRLSAKRTKSRLGKIIAKPFYKSVTIRSWNTAKKLHLLTKE